MEVYLLRHGIAEDDSPTGRDQDRRLTAEGRQKLQNTLKVASAAGVAPDVILSSPYVRAWQTAEIAKDILKYGETIQSSNALVPEAEPREVWSEIRNLYADARSLILASHEPLMSRCTGFLLGYPDLQVDFKKGGIACIEINHFGLQPRGVLKWMLAPKLART